MFSWKVGKGSKNLQAHCGFLAGLKHRSQLFGIGGGGVFGFSTRPRARRCTAWGGGGGKPTKFKSQGGLPALTPRRVMRLLGGGGGGQRPKTKGEKTGTEGFG